MTLCVDIKEKAPAVQRQGLFSQFDIRQPGYLNLSVLDPWFCVSVFQRICPYRIKIILLLEAHLKL